MFHLIQVYFVQTLCKLHTIIIILFFFLNLLQVDVTASSIALQSLLGVENILQSSSWDVGFSLVSRDDNETMVVDVFVKNFSCSVQN